ncbi:MAG: hypothetical protein AVDCRST_MAG67-4359, partial [uncultured Solirubrobacteraceae bacterium]
DDPVHGRRHRADRARRARHLHRALPARRREPLQRCDRPRGVGAAAPGRRAAPQGARPRRAAGARGGDLLLGGRAGRRLGARLPAPLPAAVHDRRGHGGAQSARRRAAHVADDGHDARLGQRPAEAGLASGHQPAGGAARLRHAHGGGVVAAADLPGPVAPPRARLRDPPARRHRARAGPAGPPARDIVGGAAVRRAHVAADRGRARPRQVPDHLLLRGDRSALRAGGRDAGAGRARRARQRRRSPRRGAAARAYAQGGGRRLRRHRGRALRPASPPRHRRRAHGLRQRSRPRGRRRRLETRGRRRRAAVAL